MAGERMAKRSSFGSKVRKRLSDITNTQSLPNITTHEEKPTEVSPATDDLINQLIKEKTTLLRHVEERNKIIELSGNELQNLRITLQKLQLQNWNLAQANSQLSAELNFGRERVKALQHELLCKDALLKSKSKEQEKGEEVDGESLRKLMQMLNLITGIEGVRQEVNACGYVSLDYRSTSSEKEKPENKRRCSRRQSARFRSQEEEPTENLFEIGDTQLPITFEGLTCKGVSNAPIDSNEKEIFGTRNEASALQRSSIGRPSRRASAKIQSYKEIPINIKMRRAE